MGNIQIYFFLHHAARVASLHCGNLTSTAVYQVEGGRMKRKVVKCRECPEAGCAGLPGDNWGSLLLLLLLVGSSRRTTGAA